MFSVCRLVSRRCYYISTIRQLSAAPLRTVLALLTHTAPHMCHSRAVFGRAMRCNFVSTNSPRLCAGGVSSHRSTLCCLLSSGGVTRHLRYYETIRLPMLVSSASPVTVVGTLSHLGREHGVSRVATLSLCHACHGLRPRGADTAKPISAAPVLASAALSASPFPIVFTFRGSIPSAFRLTAYMLAVLRLRLGITPRPPRTRYPAAG